MKTIKIKVIRILLWFGLSASLTSCARDQVRDFIPGTYVNSAGGEFSMASDTLMLERVGGNNYVVHRRTSYHLISLGKIGPKEYETEEWSAVYVVEKQVLLETRKGKVISFDPDGKAMKVGKRVYVKVNELD